MAGPLGGSGFHVRRARPGRIGLVLGPLLAFSLASAGASSALAQINPQGPRGRHLPSGETLYSIEGRVVAYSERSPVQSAQVTLIDFTGAIRTRSYTDDGGLFAFYDLPQGRYLVVASHPGFQEQNYTVDLYGGPQVGLEIVITRSTRADESPTGSAIPAWALHVPSNAREAYNKGLKEFQKGNHKKCITHLEAAVQAYPNYAAAYSALGAAHLRLGEMEAAVASFEKALQIDRNLPDACLGLGALYSGRKRYPEAEELLLRARQLKPDDWRVHYELGQSYWGAEDWAKAEASLRRALELHWDFPRLHLLLISVLALQEKYPDTLAQMETFLKLFPQDPFAPQVRQKRDLLKAQLQAGVSSAPPKPP